MAVQVGDVSNPPKACSLQSGPLRPGRACLARQLPEAAVLPSLAAAAGGAVNCGELPSGGRDVEPLRQVGCDAPNLAPAPGLTRAEETVTVTVAVTPMVTLAV